MEWSGCREGRQHKSSGNGGCASAGMLCWLSIHSGIYRLCWRAHICLLYVVAIMKRWSASAAIADTRLMYRAFCSLRWDSIRLPTEGPLWNGMEELEPCHAGLVGRQACALSA